MFTAIKLGVLAGWAIIIFNWISPLGGDMQTILHWSGIGLAAAHFIEMLIFLPKTRQAPGSTASHAIQLFVFGVVHYLALSKTSKA